MRKFEKISIEQFLKDKCGTKEDYETYDIPHRKTKNSCGYDFELLSDITINPGEIVKIPLGVKVSCEEDEFLMIVVRSSMGFKYNIRLTNQVGIIDSDYYNNPDNEGHMWASIQNEGKEPRTLKKGSAICQGIFLKYNVVQDEDIINNKRTGGIGSTSKN